jgi:hypothetical protein
MAEPTRAEPDAARIIFYVAAVLRAIYGLGLLLFPQVMFNLTQDPGSDYRGVQWLSWLQILGVGILAAALWWLSAKAPLPKRPPQSSTKPKT